MRTFSRPAPRNGDHIAAGPRAGERAAGPPGNRRPPAGGSLRPSQVPARPAARPLPQPLRAGLERLSGLDLAAVRVHYNSARPAGLGALACTHGTHIEVGPGHERHLPHEGWHVVQQLQGRVAATVQAKDRSAGSQAAVGLNEDAALEREAEAMGARARQLGQGLAPSGTPSRQDGGPARAGLRRGHQAGESVVQRVRGGLEYTEDTPTQIWAYNDKPFPANVPKFRHFQVGSVPMTSFLLGPGRDLTPNADLGSWTNQDLDVLVSTPYVKLTNDVNSAEWVIERHRDDLPVGTMRKRLREDVSQMFAARAALARAVTQAGAGHHGEVGIAPGTEPDTAAAPAVFIYSPGPAKGKAQITAKYTKEDTIRRINKLNVSKYLTGSKVAEGEDIPRITGSERRALRRADLAGTTSFSTAGALLHDLASTSNVIRRTFGGGHLLTQDQVGLVKLMVINDAMATTMVRYLDAVGQAQDKNIQRFFPKTRRNEYVKTIAQADLDATELAALRAEILRTSAADARLVFARADPGALRTDEAFTEFGTAHGLDDPTLAAMQHAKLQVLDPTRGVPSAAALQDIKVTVLGPNGALLLGNIQRAADAYTELIAATGEKHIRFDRGKGDDVTNVIVTSRGFTDLKGDRGAVYEMREREIGIDRTGRFNIGSLSALNDAIDRIFGAAE
jgi:uncharacterized protein DUF4157